MGPKNIISYGETKELKRNVSNVSNDNDFCPFKTDFDSTIVGPFSLESKLHLGISQIDRWDWEDKMENYEVYDIVPLFIDSSLHTLENIHFVPSSQALWIQADGVF